jgi:hypothetical protein
VASSAPTKPLHNSAVRFTLGGFLEATSIFRSRNQTSDVATPWNTIPFPNSSAYNMSEFRGTARQSRLSLLGEGDVDKNTALAAYLEVDFLGAAPTANSGESNSYTPRLRQAYATLDRSDRGLHVLAGQSWSLLTQRSEGMTPRRELPPLTIDAQFVPGFTWTRNPQLRVVADVSKTVSVGLSLESPQASIFSGPNPPSVPTTFNNPGGLYFAPTTTYSTDIAPDAVAKLAYDPGWGHYELYGVGRLFRSRANGRNDTIIGGGAGASALLPLIPKRLELQASFLAGAGIGRYGSAQLPDVAVEPSGNFAPIPEIQALVGLVGHPNDEWDVYLYGGTEQAGRTSFAANGQGFGYGSPLYDNRGCLTEGSTVCAANTSGIWQLTSGAWYKIYNGSVGILQAGAQYSYTRRDIFPGVGGGPGTDQNVFMASLRYYPF